MFMRTLCAGCLLLLFVPRLHARARDRLELQRLGCCAFAIRIERHHPYQTLSERLSKAARMWAIPLFRGQRVWRCAHRQGLSILWPSMRADGLWRGRHVSRATRSPCAALRLVLAPTPAKSRPPTTIPLLHGRRGPGELAATARPLTRLHVPRTSSPCKTGDSAGLPRCACITPSDRRTAPEIEAAAALPASGLRPVYLALSVSVRHRKRQAGFQTLVRALLSRSARLSAVVILCGVRPRQRRLGAIPPYYLPGDRAYLPALGLQGRHCPNAGTYGCEYDTVREGARVDGDSFLSLSSTHGARPMSRRAFIARPPDGVLFRNRMRVDVMEEPRVLLRRPSAYRLPEIPLTSCRRVSL